MINGVQNVYMYSSDMKRSINFYTEILGMKLIFENEHWASMDCFGLTVGIHWTEGEAVPQIPRNSHGPTSGACLTLKSDNIKEDRNLLESAGSNILGEFDAEWGHMLVFEDLDKNVIQLMNPKY